MQDKTLILDIDTSLTWTAPVLLMAAERVAGRELPQSSRYDMLDWQSMSLVPGSVWEEFDRMGSYWLCELRLASGGLLPQLSDSEYFQNYEPETYQPWNIIVATNRGTKTDKAGGNSPQHDARQITELQFDFWKQRHRWHDYPLRFCADKVELLEEIDPARSVLVDHDPQQLESFRRAGGYAIANTEIYQDITGGPTISTIADLPKFLRAMPVLGDQPQIDA